VKCGKSRPDGRWVMKKKPAAQAVYQVYQESQMLAFRKLPISNFSYSIIKLKS